MEKKLNLEKGKQGVGGEGWEKTWKGFRKSNKVGKGKSEPGEGNAGIKSI